MKRLSISQICKKYPHESHHSIHVAMTGLELFDRTYGWLAIPSSERKMVEACCMLHDIGFARSPDNHELASAMIVLERGLAGFSDAQVGCIAAAILLHARNFSKHLGHPLIKSSRCRKKIFRLAAYLRIADGLDHGHIQDVRILSVEKKRTSLHLTISSAGYWGNVRWAGLKADLWDSIFELKLKISALQEKRSRPRFSGVIGRDDTAVYALFKILMSQFRILGDNHRGAVAGVDPEHLHDLRVALRRFRAALKIVAPLVGRMSCRRIEHVASEISQNQGGARDAQVWMEFLKAPEHAADFESDEGWDAYFTSQDDFEKKQMKQIRALLGSGDYSRFWQKVNYFMRINMLMAAGKTGSVSFAWVMIPRIIKAHKKIMAMPARITDLSSEETHLLRKKCRRYRYWAEFAAPVLGRDAARLAGKLAELTDALGLVHDMDVHWDRLARNKSFILPSLHSTMALTRKDALKRATVVWREMHERKAARRLAGRLVKMRDKF